MGAAPASAASVTTAKATVADLAQVVFKTDNFVTHDGVVSDVPVLWTPQPLSGQTNGIEQVGDSMVVVGTFTEVQERNGSAIAQPYAFAFDATDGTINTDFDPVIDGGVLAVEAGPTPGTVFVGGGYGGVNGDGGKLHLLNVSDGSLVTSFDAPALNGRVDAMQLVGDNLYVGGIFTTAGGVPRGGLMKLDANTGALSSDLDLPLTEHHNWTGADNEAFGPIGAKGLAVDADETTLAVVGNFKKVDGLDRDQMVLIDLTGATAQVRTDWRTRRYEDRCAARAFDSYIRDVSFAPDGSYVNVATTGGPFTGSLCDTGTRWDIADTGDDVQPAWTNVTGGDTLLSSASSGDVTYFGGHQRWMNNNDGRDFASPGAVPRPGLAGVDVDNGVPLTWNPGRNPRGIGADALLVTDAGLWVGSDTLFVGNYQYRRPRLAFFPLDGGYELGADDAGSLPSNLYSATDLDEGDSADSTGLVRRFYEGGAVPSDGIEETVPAGGIDWSEVRDAFVVDGTLYYATTGNAMYRRSFDGSTYGDEELVDPYNDPFWSDVRTGTRDTVYRGSQPSFYAQLPSLAGMSYADKRLYYTQSGANSLFSRGFSPDSGIMTQEVQTDATFDQENVGAIFIDADAELLYFANTETGTLSSIAFADGAVSGQATVQSGPGIDGMNWATSTLFIGPGDAPVPNEAPGAAFDVECDRLDCTFDGSASTDSDGSISSYAWDFGDGETATGETPTHTFPEDGAYEVTLTVRDNDGARGLVTTTVTVGANEAPEAVIGIPDCELQTCTLSGADSTDPDDSVVDWSWNFGDGSPVEAGEEVNHTFGAAGTYPVELTVTDEFGATGSVTRDVEVFDSALEAPQIVGQATSNSRGATPAVQIPNAVQTGDLMVLFVATNQSGEATGPSGVGDWTQESREVQGPLAVTVYTRVADGSEAGQEISVTLPSGSYRTDMTVAAYRNVGSEGVESIEVNSVVRSDTHTTPEAAVLGNNRRALSYWADRSSTTTSWTAPADVELVSESYGTTTARVTSYLGQAEADAGTYGGLLATTNAQSARGVAYTLILEPGDGTPVEPANVAPAAVIGTADCVLLDCAFDGSGSSDPDAGDSVVSYDWDFGDGSTGSGEAVSHSFAVAGRYTVSLTVTDSRGATGVVTRVVNVDDAVVDSPVLVGDVNATGLGTSVSVELPGYVQAGDALVAFFTANQSGEGGAPVGVGAWDQVGREVNGPLAVSVFSRVADGSEGGQELVLSVPDRARMDVTVVVYRGVGGVPVEVAESLAVRNSASHVSPEVSVGGAGRVVLSFWADRSSSTTSWTAPGGLDEVSNVVGTGGGRLATLLGAATAGAGTYGGLTATTDAPSSRGVAYTVVLQP